MNGPGPSLLRRVRRNLGDITALIYLIVCALLLGWALVVASDESMGGVIPLLATAPASIVLLVALPEGIATFFVSIIFGALINALVIGWCARALRRGA
ncbi:hypothetical protein PJ985_03070 [Streptomyces sp. ACA25]|uniref:SCO4225 family membrane protein n=1 Tax=Streptomyces sp. ACA25 TaxID=3022596 RepID=UPI002307EF8F|nr:hypothetical protein [Streptomyces sp. ACA25]MDB1086547.1 hypothetical protein [Streptomyces sp. ACA25]